MERNRIKPSLQSEEDAREHDGAANEHLPGGHFRPRELECEQKYVTHDEAAIHPYQNRWDWCPQLADMLLDAVQ